MLSSRACISHYTIYTSGVGHSGFNNIDYISEISDDDQSMLSPFYQAGTIILIINLK